MIDLDQKKTQDWLQIAVLLQLYISKGICSFTLYLL